MPSLRKRVSSYFRQLSFHNEPREKRHNVNENSFVTKYLQGQVALREGPPVLYGKNPTDLPNYELGQYETGSDTIVGCYSGPSGGLTTVKRTEKHLSVLDADIDFIDTPQDEPVSVTINVPKNSPYKKQLPVDNTTMVIKVAGQEYCVTNRITRKSKSQSLGSLSDIDIDKTKVDSEFYSNNNSDSFRCKNMDKNNEILNGSDAEDIKNEAEHSNVTEKELCKSNNDTNLRNDTNSHSETIINGAQSAETKSDHTKTSNKKIVNETAKTNDRKGPSERKRSSVRTAAGSDSAKQNFALAKSKSEGNPFQHKKKGKIIRITQRPTGIGDDTTAMCADVPVAVSDDRALPKEWNIKSDFVFGVSDSLYDRNQVTKRKNGDPIADCFGVIARGDSAILALADGVNWGEKASIAAKSAVHGCLHYLNKTIFNDTKPFDNLTIKPENLLENSHSSSKSSFSDNRIVNTREVFVCLLRAFNCAHDLILENKGMLTTLTVAVVLPLKPKHLKRAESHVGKDQASLEDEYMKYDRDRQFCHADEDTSKSDRLSDRSSRSGSFRSEEQRYVCCVCNVGDTLAYVYSQKYGVRELTKGSHDINCNRDMRDALGALGPVDGINPELSNLTLSITTLQKGDIVLVASDGLTDNFDPNVCRFTVNCTIPEPVKVVSRRPNPPVNREAVRHVRSSSKENKKTVPPVKPPRKSKTGDSDSRSSTERSLKSESSLSENSIATAVQEKTEIAQPKPVEKVDKNTDTQLDYDNPLIKEFMTQNSLDETKPKPIETKKSATIDAKKPFTENRASSLRKSSSQAKHHEHKSHTATRKTPPQKQVADAKKQNTAPKTAAQPSESNAQKTYKFLRSRTSLDFRGGGGGAKQILRNDEGIPFVTPLQRYELTLLLMEDVLRRGISGRESQCTSAKRLCENLVSFTVSITAAKRRTLEDADLYFDNRNGVLVEVSAQEKKIRRKRGLERVQNLPGKLDHVSVVAYNVGNFGF